MRFCHAEDRIQPFQIFNLLVGCSPFSGRPQYMKVLPGNVKEGSAVSMLDEFEIPEGTILVMDRGYYDKTLLSQIRDSNLEFIVAVRRNPDMYKVTGTSEGMFRWRRSAVAYGHCGYDDGWVYRFENLNRRNDELVDDIWHRNTGRNVS